MELGFNIDFGEYEASIGPVLLRNLAVRAKVSLLNMSHNLHMVRALVLTLISTKYSYS